MLRVIMRHADDLRLPSCVNGAQLLAALATIESSGGRNQQPNFEPAFWVGGVYWNDTLEEYRNRWELAADPHMKELVGKTIACSWGPWQILYVTATELGYDGPPWLLADPDTCLAWAVRLINHRLVPKLPPDAGEIEVVEKVADGYNSGSFLDRYVPQNYITRLRFLYASDQTLGRLAILRAAC